MMSAVKVCPVCSREFVAGATHCLDDGVALVALSRTESGRPEELIGKVVEGRYRVERIVGRGGMGTVYACRHVVVGKTVALKVLRPSVDKTEGVLQRFIREAQTTNLLKSRHIVEIADFGQLSNGLFFVVMELLEGRDLTHAMRSGTLSRADLIHIFMQMAETLARAHELGVVHRDLKPDNVFLVNEAGDPLFVKLLDFGIAKLLDGGNAGLTETGVILGTPYYMSPEQARAEAVDHRTDIYALGVIMYRAFTGRLPFIADSTMGVLTRHLSEPPEPPSKVSAVHPKAEVLILRCLEKRPEHRPQSMREVVLELRGMLLEEQQRQGRRGPDNATVNERGVGSIPPVAPIPTPSRMSAGDSYPPRGSHPSGPDGSGPHGSGPHGSGPHGSGPHGSGPHGSGPHPSGMHRSGPHPSGAHALTGELHGHDAGDRLSSDHRVSQEPGSMTGTDGRPRSSSPASFDSALTSLRWPPGTTGSTGRGFVTSSLPPPGPRQTTVLLLGALGVFAAGVVVAALFFFMSRTGAPPATVTPAVTGSPPSPVVAATASAAASFAVAPPAPPPSTTATAAAPSASASPSSPSSPVRPRVVFVAPPAKPSASAPPKRPTVEIRSPFD
jgi:eukaryotic-like serine/threonine-protein kinase